MYIFKTSAGDRDWVADRNLNCSDLDLKKKSRSRMDCNPQGDCKAFWYTFSAQSGKHLNPSSFKGANCR